MCPEPTLQTDKGMGNPTVWRPLRNKELGVLNSISSLVAELELKCPRMLTCVRRGPRLIMASDYSGEDRESAAKVYSFLLADACYLWLWHDMRTRLRRSYLPNARRMSYKALNDKYRKSALVPFLRIANAIPGLLITFIVDHEIESLFGQTASDAVQAGIIPRDCKPRTSEKMLRIAALGGLVLAGMAAPRQDILWFTDEDDIVANEKRLREATRFIGSVTGGLVSHEMGQFKFGTAKCDNGSKEIEDLLAIPDLVSGTLSEMSQLLLGPDKNGPALYGKECADKAGVVMNWMADGSEHTLKKLVICIIRVGGSLKTRCINFSALVRRQEFFWREDARAVLGGRLENEAQTRSNSNGPCQPGDVGER